MKNKKVYALLGILVVASLILLPAAYYLSITAIPQREAKQNAEYFLNNLIEGEYENALLVFTTPNLGGEGKTGENLPDADRQAFVENLQKLELDGIKILGFDKSTIDLGTDQFCLMGVNIQNVEVSTDSGTENVAMYLTFADGKCPPEDVRFSNVSFSLSSGDTDNEVVNRLQQAFSF